jgi:hypothetical protein
MTASAMPFSKKKQIGNNHTQEGTDLGRQPSEQVEGEQQEGRGRRKGKKLQGAGEEPRNTRPQDI